MFLSVDVGNSQTTFALMDEAGDVHAGWRCQSDPKETTDELALRLDGYLRLRGFTAADVDACAVASVVPALERFASEQVAAGLVEEDWEPHTLAESPFFPGWREKWGRQQGV